MEVTITGRIKNAWNAFMNRDQIPRSYISGSYRKPDRVLLTRGNERSIVTSVLNRIAMDVAAIDITHCRGDENDGFKEEIKSSLNNCLTLESNIDQSCRAFIQDIVLTMFDEGCVAIVPVDTSDNPNNSNSYDILTMRVGKITEWFPRHVKVYVYNDRTGKKEEIFIAKEKIGIIENPLYAVMNENNSTLRRLTRKLVLLDAVDEQNSSGKLDLIIQLPYIIKSQARKDQANERRQEIERQLAGSKYGIAYTDGTEKITQLNRPVENNLMKQIEYLTSMLYSQLGITASILDGTADEKTMLNYYSRTIEPIVSAIVLEMTRKFLTKTARTQGQTIKYFRDPFKLVPVKELAELADKFTRNEILSSNEVRSVIGIKPSDDPRANELRNSNISQSKEETSGVTPSESQNGVDDESDSGDKTPITPGNIDPNEIDFEAVIDSLTDEQAVAVQAIIEQAVEDERNNRRR